jgi:hypothetical protein
MSKIVMLPICRVLIVIFIGDLLTQFNLKPEKFTAAAPGIILQLCRWDIRTREVLGQYKLPESCCPFEISGFAPTAPV